MDKKIDWLAGCSGFSYRDWKPVFYPEKLPTRSWLNYYSGQFRTLESNTTFYHIPKPATLQNWYGQTPAGFVFSVKAPRLITHYKKMIDTHESVMRFNDLVISNLQEKLGCVLFQFPPNFVFSAERLDLILEQMDPAISNVVEFRHRSWWAEEVYTALRQAGVSFCGISHPNLPNDIIPGFATQYFRFHGVPQLYRSSYTTDYLDRVIGRLNDLPETKTAYLYFNNTIAATAIANVRYVLSRTTAAQ